MPPPQSQAPGCRPQLSTPFFSIHRGSAILSTAQKAKPSWEKRLQQRAELKSLQAAQSAANDTIIAEKRVRRRGRCCGAGPHGSHTPPARCAQAARAAREAKALRKKENQEKGLSYQVVRSCSALHPGRPVGERRLLNRACCAADHQHEEDQEDEQEAA